MRTADEPVRGDMVQLEVSVMSSSAKEFGYANPRCMPAVLHLEIEFDPSSSLDELAQAAREIMRRRLAKLRSDEVVPLETD